MEYLDESEIRLTLLGQYRFSFSIPPTTMGRQSRTRATRA
jgi:hypothetical protein